MVSDKQLVFYKEWLMGREKFNPRDFGIDMDREEYIDMMICECSDFTRGALSIDELLLRPTLAMEFVKNMRMKHGFYDVPEDVILRPIMNQRKASKK